VDRIEVETALGPVWLWGRVTGKPVLLLINGFGAKEAALSNLQDMFADFDVLRTHLPGNHCPALQNPSIAVFAEALSEACRKLVKAPLGVCGISTGALVAMAMKGARVQSLLVVEPPIFTEALWMMPASDDLAWRLFGAHEGRIVNRRDYSGLIADLSVPTTALLGDVPPFPIRKLDALPSFVTDQGRALLTAHPLVTIRDAPGCGHNILWQAPACS
jgi:pimeloyl-ACP methyl ester carboxylesterase